jgi:hypothetical protein
VAVRFDLRRNIPTQRLYLDLFFLLIFIHQFRLSVDFAIQKHAQVTQERGSHRGWRAAQHAGCSSTQEDRFLPWSLQLEH